MTLNSPLVQALVVETAAPLRATQLYPLLGHASLQNYLRTPNEHPVRERWAHWEAQNYRKSVRRAKPKDFNKVLESLSALSVPFAPYVEESTRGRVLALSPLYYEEFPKALSRTQVSGFQVEEDLPRVSALEHVPSGALLVDETLAMSPGKTAVQVAHAHWLAYSQGYGEAPATVMLASHQLFEEVREESELVIIDAGLTELPGPTATVTIKR